MSIDAGFASQAPSLPGEGSLKGLGETFTPDLSTGTGAFNLPFEIPNGPNDIGPKLSLRYDSSAGNGAYGLGWALPLPRILRSSMVGRPRYDDTDTLVLEGSGPLVRLPDGTLHPEVETGDWRIEPLAGGFRVTDRAGMRFELGQTDDSRLPGLAGATWAWLLHRIEDNLGNVAEFTWRAAGAQRYLQSISYGPYRVEFQYAARPDPLRWGRGGFLLLTEERCTSVELHLVGAAQPLMRRWSLGYVSGQPNGASLLASVALTGFDDAGAPLAAPPIRFDYTAPGAPRLTRMPVQDEGAMPPGLDGRGRVELVDWFGHGLPDLLEIGSAGTARVWPNQGGSWGRPQSAGLVPQLAGTQARAALIDFDGNGLADVVRVDQPLRGYQPRDDAGFARPVAWLQAPGMALSSPECRLADFDGDGIVDLLWSNGRALMLLQRDEAGGWQSRPSVTPATPGGPPTDLADPHVFSADMTGDGTPDVVRVDGGGVTYWPYLGYGVFGDAVVMRDPPRLPFNADPSRLFVVDLDGDGCADVVYVDDGVLRWWPNRAGSGFEPPREIAHVPTGAISQVRIADLLGTGNPSLCWTVALPSGRARWFALDPLGGVRCGLLAAIDNAIGRRTTVRYSNSAQEAERDRQLGQAWTTRLPIVLPVISEVTVDDVGGAHGTTRYRYHQGRYDRVLREVCGFGCVDTDELGDATVPTLRTTRWFHTGLQADGSEPDTRETRRRMRAIRGRLLKQERSAEDGTLFDRMEQTWRVDDDPSAQTVVPRLQLVRQSTFEGSPTPASWIITQQLAWDAEGNVTEAEEHSFSAGIVAPAASLHTLTDYAADPAGRFRQRLARVRQFDGDGHLLAETRTEYDHLSLGQVGAQGLVTSRAALAMLDTQVADVYGADLPDFPALGYTRRAGVDGWWVDLGRYDRTVDLQGLHGSVTGPRGGTTSLGFDATGCYPVRVTDMQGNEIRAEFDLRAYQPVAITEPSGARSTASFDALARLVRKVLPGDSDAEPTIAYQYDTSQLPVSVTVQRRTSATTPAHTERDLIDGGGRLLERRVRDELGDILQSRHVYGARGVLLRAHLPVRATAAGYVAPDASEPHTAIVYDAMGRALRTTRPDGATSHVRYLPGMIEESDEEDTRSDAAATHTGTVTRRILDAAGRVVRVEQLLGAQVLASFDSFDIKGQLLEHVDASGASTRFTHDLLGRLLRLDRPEGRQVAVFDASGNNVETRSGTAVVRRRYDLANRPTEVRHGAEASPPVARYTYHDNGAPAPADAGLHTAGGRLVRIDDESGSTTFDYDERGQIARKTMRSGADGPFTLQLAHRPDGLIDRITYPDATEVGYHYDLMNRLQRVDGVIDAIEYDLAGHRSTTRYSNGVVQQDDHDPLTTWRTHSQLTGPGGSLRELGYEHDRVGNLLALTSADPALAWQYRYDDLYRLVQATSAAGDWHYGYDAAGNIVSNSALGGYSYGGAGLADTCLRSAGPDVYGYDERGHVATAPWGAHTIDPEGRLRRIDLAAGGRHEFTYDHAGTLARRRVVDAADAVTSEVWSPDKLLRVEDGELVLQFTDGQRIVARQRAGQRQWLHADHLGSLTLVTDAAGAMLLKLAYGPYGQVLSHTGPGAAPQGYGTGETLGPDLVLLGARWYSPRLGRFLSPDSLISDAIDPLAWNLYAYCRCNPTSYVDPSGRSFWKIFGAILATVAIIALAVIVTICTFGAAGPGAAALAVGGVSITWGAVFAATMVGIVAGGVIGGIAAARAGGDAGDILLGVLVGGAVGGWAAFGAAFAGVGVAGGLGLTSGTVGAGVVSGGISGMINGAAMGFASGFAGGKNNGFKDIMEKVLVGAIVGLAIGAALGALSGIQAPKESLQESVKGTLQPSVPSAPNPALPPGALSAPAAEINTGAGAAQAIGTAAAGKLAGAVAPHFLAAIAGFTGNYVAQTVLVDLTSAGASAFWDDLQQYVRTHKIDLGPFDFIKGDF